MAGEVSDDRGLSQGQPSESTTHEYVFFFRIEGDLRFISHHDTVRMIHRGLARAGLPVRFSQGFNPHPRLSLPLPRPVGIASDCECLIVEFTAPVNAETAGRDLQKEMPPGVEFFQARRLEPREKLRPSQVRYRLEIEGAADRLADRISELLESANVVVARKDKKSGTTREIDLRPYIVDLRIVNQTVEFTLQVTGAGTAKPAEIASLLGLDADSINHRIRRMEVQWKSM